MYSIERKSEIINILENSGRVDVSILADKFGTSKETIRRDLRELEDDGVIRRTHGGAVLSQPIETVPPTEEYPITIRGIQRFNEKNDICKRAAAFIEDGDTIFIDNSSTTMYLTKYIAPELHVTIITNSIKVLVEYSVAPNPHHVLICLGGIFNSSNLSLYGSSSLKSAEIYYPNKAFLSCAGISRQNILADSSIYEIDTKRMMIERAPEVFMLADYTKIQKNSQIFLCKMSDVNYLITDSKTEVDKLDFLDRSRLNLVVAP
jgi:Transcriptional regulators of sugar metabolism